MVEPSPSFADILGERAKLTDRLKVALAHLSHEQQIHIITSFMSIKDLEAMVLFQEGKNNG